MACLGGRAELSLLQTATGEPAGVVGQQLAPALDEGVLVVEPGPQEAVRFRHDRIREAILGGLDTAAAARAAAGDGAAAGRVPELFAVAAEQYLPVVDAVSDPAERRAGGASCCVAPPTRRRLIGDYALVHALLAAALRLVEPGETATLDRGAHRPPRRPVQPGAPGGGGRGVPRDRAAVPHRDRARRRDVRAGEQPDPPEAIRRGDRPGRRSRCASCGIAVPAGRPARPPSSTASSSTCTGGWTAPTADDLARPEITDPTLLAATRLINAILPAAYFVADHAMFAWLSLEALRIWLEHGPGPTLRRPGQHRRLPRRGASAATTPPGTGRCGGSWRWARPAATSPAPRRRATCSPASVCWFEPIENGVHAAQRAREGLIAGGDLANAGYTYYADGAVPAGLRADAGRLRRRGGGGAGLRAADRQRADRPVARQLPVAGRGAARRNAPAQQTRRGPADRYADNPLALLLRAPHPGDRRRRLRRSGRPGPAHRGGDAAAAGRPRASTRPPWPTCCAGWPSPGRPAPPR